MFQNVILTKKKKSTFVVLIFSYLDEENTSWLLVSYDYGIT
jgi:hypothetical protein